MSNTYTQCGNHIRRSLFLSFFSLTLLTIASCTSKAEIDKPIAKTETDFQTDTIGCDCNDLAENDENAMLKNGVKYTGTCTRKQFDDKSNKEYRQYKNGLLDGTYYAWHEDGKPKLKIDFIKGVVHGKFLEWDEKGKQITDISFDQGKLHGSSYVFNEDKIRYAVFFADSKVSRFDQTVYSSTFDDDFKSFKSSFGNIGLLSTNPLICISTHFAKENGNELLVMSDHLKNIEDLNAYLDFVKQFENDHKLKINIDEYKNTSSTFDRSKDFAVWNSYGWIVKGKKKEIDNTIYEKLIGKKVGFDPAFMTAFNNGTTANTASSSGSGQDIFEDVESDESYDYTR